MPTRLNECAILNVARSSVRHEKIGQYPPSAGNGLLQNGHEIHRLIRTEAGLSNSADPWNSVQNMFAMELAVEFFRIRRDGAPITLPEWDEIIVSHASFEQIPDRAGTNPSTKEKVVFPGAGKTYYVAGGERLGNASLEDGEILTTGVPQDLCEQIAQFLSASVYEDDRS